MKKKIIFGISILFILVVGITILVVNKNDKAFYLENNYYGVNTMTEINIDELNEFIDNKESFAVFVYQPMCITSSDFERVLKDFLEENKISIYKIAFSNIKETNIGKSVKYYPSFIIYNKGKMVDFLEADKDDDVEFFTSKDGFEKWFTKYVKLKDNSSINTILSDNKNILKDNNMVEDMELEDVVKDENKVNIYFFWGDGCPHCEEEFSFFESIKEEYGDYYNLYFFETWYNKKNEKLVYTFAEKMGDEVTGVPYTIIGNKSFSGFGKNSKEDFIKAIKEYYQNSYDVYFDKIKK